MKIHLTVIIILASLLFVPSCLSKTIDQKPIEEVTQVEPVKYEAKKITSTPKVKPEIKAVSIPEFETQILKLVNAERAKQGLKALKVNQKLITAAQSKAQDLVTLKYWSHTSPEGKMVNDFIRSVGYKYELVGENLAHNYKTAAEVVTAWMNSLKHKENIVSREFTEVGIAKNQNIVVLVLAKPL